MIHPTIGIVMMTGWSRLHLQQEGAATRDQDVVVVEQAAAGTIKRRPAGQRATIQTAQMSIKMSMIVQNGAGALLFFSFSSFFFFRGRQNIIYYLSCCDITFLTKFFWHNFFNIMPPVLCFSCLLVFISFFFNDLIFVIYLVTIEWKVVNGLITVNVIHPQPM